MVKHKSRKLFESLREEIPYIPPDVIESVVFPAYILAEKAHQNQKRRSGEPYITHPIAVARILANTHMNHEVIAAALLHDVVEDTPITKSEITEKFGPNVAMLVDGVTKLSRIEFKNKAEAHAESFHKMVLAISQDVRVVIIKLADRLHNMRTLGGLAPQKRRRIARETLELYAPIAHRLGMHNAYSELRSLGFSMLYPKRYHVLEETVDRLSKAQKKIFRVVSDALQAVLQKNALSHCQVLMRKKDLYGIYQKMLNRGISFKQITDIYGFRIITDSQDTCYRVLGLVHSTYKPIPEKFKDYIAIPKANGYQSLHTTLFGPSSIPIEVQIRTKKMESLASSGVAAHWLYKSNQEALHETRECTRKWIGRLLDMQKQMSSVTEFIENVKVDLFPDKVYVFTPKGKIVALPSGATVVDFAYALHLDIGNTCVAAKVDHQPALLSTVLHSGQVVEVSTDKQARPNPSWLDFVVTARSRSGILHHNLIQKRKRSINLGKVLLKQALKQYDISLRRVSSKHLAKLLQMIGVSSLEDLLEDVGLGNRLPALLAYQLANELDTKSATAKEPLLITETEGMVLRFSTCCYPIPGDRIAGILTKGEGLAVHVQECTRIQKFRKHHEEILPIAWSRSITEEFLCTIVIFILNKRGVFAKVAQAIADEQGNLDNIAVLERGRSYYKLLLRIYVRNRKHLASIMRCLRKLDQVIKLNRSIQNSAAIHAKSGESK